MACLFTSVLTSRSDSQDSVLMAVKCISFHFIFQNSFFPGLIKILLILRKSYRYGVDQGEKSHALFLSVLSVAAPIQRSCDVKYAFSNISLSFQHLFLQ